MTRVALNAGQAIPSHTERRSIFEHYVRTRADEERKEKRAAQKAAVEGFKQLLEEATKVLILSCGLCAIMSPTPVGFGGYQGGYLLAFRCHSLTSCHF